MPPCSNSARPTVTAADATAEVKGAAVPAAETNHQPDMVSAELEHRCPCIHLLSSNIGIIGTTATRMVVTTTIPTRAQHAGNPSQRTTRTGPTPTRWAERRACTRQSCTWRAAVLHPAVAPSSSSSPSNVRPSPTTQLKVQPGSRHPHRHCPKIVALCIHTERCVYLQSM
jgi:hypothetical protein